MSNYKFLTLIISLFTLICFTIKAYAITENQYLVINKLINEENIDKAFSDLKLMQKDEVKLSARSQILIGKLNKTEVLNKDGFIPEDVNVGISGQVLSNFLNIPIKANLSESKKYDASQIYEYMRPSVVFIVSQ